MRKVAVALFFIAALGMLAPPVFAQAPAPAPAPKVTINGLVDFVATYYSNWSGGPAAALREPRVVSTSDVTNTRDKGWYTRERGVFTITGEVGRSRAVWAIELDFTNGAGSVGNSGNAFNGGNNGQSFPEPRPTSTRISTSRRSSRPSGSTSRHRPRVPGPSCRGSRSIVRSRSVASRRGATTTRTVSS